MIKLSNSVKVVTIGTEAECEECGDSRNVTTMKCRHGYDTTRTLCVTCWKDAASIVCENCKERISEL